MKGAWLEKRTTKKTRKGNWEIGMKKDEGNRDRMKGNKPEDRKDSYYWRSRDVKKRGDGEPVTKNLKSI